MKLTYIPLPGSHHVYLNGIEMQEGVDWNEIGGTLTFLPPMGERSGDLVEVLYAHQEEAPDQTEVHGPFQEWFYTVEFIDPAHITNFGEASESSANSGSFTSPTSMVIEWTQQAQGGPDQHPLTRPWWLVRETNVDTGYVEQANTGWYTSGEGPKDAGFGCGFTDWYPPGTTLKYEAAYDPVSYNSPGDWTDTAIIVAVFYVRKGGPPNVP